MNKRILGLVVVMMLLVGVGGVVVAADLIKTGDKIDTTKEANYNEAEFYKQVPPSEWKWENVQPDRLKEITDFSGITAEMLRNKIKGGGTALSHLQGTQIQSFTTQIPELTGEDLATTANGKSILEQMGSVQKGDLNYQQIFGYTSETKGTLPGYLADYNKDQIRKYGENIHGFKTFSAEGNVQLKNGNLIIGDEATTTTFDLSQFGTAADKQISGQSIEIKTEDGKPTLYFNAQKIDAGTATITADSTQSTKDSVRLVITPATTTPTQMKLADHSIIGASITEAAITISSDGLVKSLGAQGNSVVISLPKTINTDVSSVTANNGKAYLIYGADGTIKYGIQKIEGITTEQNKLSGLINTKIDSPTPGQEYNFYAENKGEVVMKTGADGKLISPLNKEPATAKKEKPTAKDGLITLQRETKSMNGAIQDKTNFVSNSGIFTPVYDNKNGKFLGWNRVSKDGFVTPIIISQESLQKLVTSTSLKGQQTTKADPVKQKTDQLTAAKISKEVVDGRKWDNDKGLWIDPNKKLPDKKTAELIADAKPKVTLPPLAEKPKPAPGGNAQLPSTDPKTEQEVRQVVESIYDKKRESKVLNNKLEGLRSVLSEMPSAAKQLDMTKQEIDTATKNLRTQIAEYEQAIDLNQRMQSSLYNKVTAEQFLRYTSELANKNDAQRAEKIKFSLAAEEIRQKVLSPATVSVRTN